MADRKEGDVLFREKIALGKIVFRWVFLLFFHENISDGYWLEARC